MDRFQVITKLDCPAHLGKKLITVVTVLDDGSVDIWKGCEECPGNSRLERTEGEKPPPNIRNIDGVENAIQTQPAQRNPIRALEIRLEMLSFTTMFLILSILLFSITSDTTQLLPYFNLGINWTNSHFFFWGLGGISALFAVTSLVLVYFPVQKIEEYIRNWRNHLRSFNMIWKISWFVILITGYVGIIDSANKIQNSPGREIAALVGSIIFLVAAVKVILTLWHRNRSDIVLA
jgi:hypothetical protein